MKQTIIAIICFLCLSSSYIQAQKINHPSLLYTPQRIQQVKQRMQNEPKLQEAWESIKQTADAALQKNDFNKLDYLALAYLMTKDKSYVNSIKEILLKAVKAETWGDKEMLARIPVWRSHLGLAHKSFLCAMGYDAAYDILSSSEKKEIAQGLKRKRKRKTERGKERSLKFCIESFGKAVRRVSELAVRRVDFCDFFAGFG